MAKTRKSSRFAHALDLAVAALAAASAGFVAFAMPDDLFSRLVTMSHVPDVLAAAQPPLGETARLGVCAGAALLAFAFVWSLLRALDNVPARPQPVGLADADEDDEAYVYAAPEPGTLRLRKADAHPDAPARLPLLAGRELGEPMDGDIEEIGDSWSEPEPQVEETAEPEPVSAPEPEPLPAFLVAQEPEPEPLLLDTEEEHAERAEEEEDETADQGASITHLMQRFESGLSRKQQAIPRTSPPVVEQAVPQAEAPAPVVDDRVGHRLRSAIAELQKVSVQGR
jgi:hypothetical protein